MLSGVIIARLLHSHSVIKMLETSLFVATLATLGMISPGPDFSGDQKRCPLSPHCRHDDGSWCDFGCCYAYVLLRGRSGGRYHDHTMVIQFAEICRGLLPDLDWYSSTAVTGRK